MIRSMRLAGMAFAFLISAVCIVGTAEEPKKDAPPEKAKEKEKEKEKGKGGFGKGGTGGFGGFGTRSTPGKIFSPGMLTTLKMTDEQKKEIEAMQKDIDAKLEKILTDDQKKQLKEMSERRPGGFPGTRPGGTPPAPPKKDD